MKKKQMIISLFLMIFSSSSLLLMEIAPRLSRQEEDERRNLLYSLFDEGILTKAQFEDENYTTAFSLSLIDRDINILEDHNRLLTIEKDNLESPWNNTSLPAMYKLAGIGSGVTSLLTGGFAATAAYIAHSIWNNNTTMNSIESANRLFIDRRSYLERQKNLWKFRSNKFAWLASQKNEEADFLNNTIPSMLMAGAIAVVSGVTSLYFLSKLYGHKGRSDAEIKRLNTAVEKNNFIIAALRSIKAEVARSRV